MASNTKFMQGSRNQLEAFGAVTSTRLDDLAGNLVVDLGAARGRVNFFLQVTGPPGRVLPGAPAPPDDLWHVVDSSGGTGPIVSRPFGGTTPPSVACGDGWSWVVSYAAALVFGDFVDDWKPDDCPPCGDNVRCTTAALDSLSFSLGLGKADHGRNATRVSLHTERPHAALCRPGSLAYSLGPSDELIRNSNYVPVQIATAGTLVQLVVVNANKFQLAEYARTADPKLPDGT
jgi:hypothetical protein